MKKGAIDSVLFSKPGYTSIGDPYQVPKVAGKRIFEHRTFTKGGHEIDFKPAKTVFERVARNIRYPYVPEGEVKKTIKKDEEGKVITGPRNFTTTRLKKGRIGKGTSFSGPIKYLEDDNEKQRKNLLK
jgi:hypothetical protein